MPDLAQLALFLAAATLLAVTPGPGLLYVAARTLAGGRAEGVASSFGTGLGGLVHVLAGAAGVSALVMSSAELFAVLKTVGALYLVRIGVRTIRDARRSDVAADLAVRAPGSTGARRAFREGVQVEALNPKTAAFFLAFVPQFVDPGAGTVRLQFVVLGLASVALNTAVDVAVAFAAGGVRESARTRPSAIRRIREASGGAMVALGLGLLLAKRPAG
ncbi:MAG TPA: LysE family translocator [Burkholderiaceae bacterium]|nr:LysE family translocator [Burkholderiaceae bacterium]